MIFALATWLALLVANSSTHSQTSYKKEIREFWKPKAIPNPPLVDVVSYTMQHHFIIHVTYGVEAMSTQASFLLETHK